MKCMYIEFWYNIYEYIRYIPELLLLQIYSNFKSYLYTTVQDHTICRNCNEEISKLIDIFFIKFLVETRFM